MLSSSYPFFLIRVRTTKEKGDEAIKIHREPVQIMKVLTIPCGRKRPRFPDSSAMKVRDGKSWNAQINYFAVLIFCGIIAVARCEKKEKKKQRQDNCARTQVYVTCVLVVSRKVTREAKIYIFFFTTKLY